MKTNESEGAALPQTEMETAGADEPKAATALAGEATPETATSDADVTAPAADAGDVVPDAEPQDEAGEENPPERRKWPKRPEKTPEDLAAIALLDRLRSGEGEKMPLNLPLACVVKVIEYEEIPKANEQYAMVTLKGHNNQTWRMCINRYYLERGMNALFVSGDAAMPVEDRYRNRDVARVKERIFRFGFGVKVRRLLPIIRRNIYIYNSGLLYPLSDFPELKGVRYGTVCAVRLHIDNVLELRSRAAMPRPKKSALMAFR